MHFFRSYIKDKPLSYSVSADLVTQWFILYNGTKEVRGSIPTQVVFPPFLGEKREVSGENHGKITLPGVESGVYHCKRTHNLKKKDHIEEKTGAG